MRTRLRGSTGTSEVLETSEVFLGAAFLAPKRPQGLTALQTGAIL